MCARWRSCPTAPRCASTTTSSGGRRSWPRSRRTCGGRAGPTSSERAWPLVIPFCSPRHPRWATLVSLPAPRTSPTYPPLLTLLVTAAPPHTHTTTATTSPQDPERQVVAIGAPHGTLRRRAGDQHPNHVAALPLQVRARARGRGPAAEAGTACVQWGSGQWRRWCSAGAAFPCHPLHLHPHPPQHSRRPPPPPAPPPPPPTPAGSTSARSSGWC